jgi:ParB-like chromosome segregation protein Spo0J
MELGISEVKVGKRHRKDMGDIEGLAKSILDIGLIQPIVVKPDKTLIVGQRRLEAFKLLAKSNPRYEKIPVNVAKTFDDLKKFLRAEADENTCRLNFTPMEAVAMGADVEKAYRPLAEEKQDEGRKTGGKAGGKGRPANSFGENFPKPKRDESARTRAVAAAAVGMSDRTYEKAKAVVASGNEEAKATMEKTRKVDGAFKKLKASNGRAAAFPFSDAVIKRLESLASFTSQTLIEFGSFSVMVAHPKWDPDKTLYAAQLIYGLQNSITQIAKEAEQLCRDSAKKNGKS